MSPAPSPGTQPADVSARHGDIYAETLDERTTLPSNNNRFHLESKITPVQPYTSLQEHTGQPSEDQISALELGFTPRYDGRREGFSWDWRPMEQDLRRPSRNPVPPEPISVETPPPLEEVLHQATIEDADSLHNATLQKADTWEDQSAVAAAARSSMSSDRLSRSDTTRSSVVGIAQGIARRIPDMRMFTQSDRGNEQVGDCKRRDSLGGSFAASTRGNKQERKLSFIFPPVLKQKSESEKPEEPSMANKQSEEKPSKAPGCQRTPRSSLRDRRKVNLDLAMPVDQLSSITPSRPRSPKTPWIRNEPLQWHHETAPRTAPILEESHISKSTIEDEKTGGVGLLPGNDIICSSHSPSLERPPQKIRDRCYLTRPRNRRSRSGRSGTSESTLPQTPEAPDQAKIRQEQHQRTEMELRQLGQTSKTTRARRCRWAGPWNSEARSSDEAPHSPLPTTRRLSMKPFKRSARISDPINAKKDGQQSPPIRFWWARKQSNTDKPTPMPLSDMPIPPAFVPPGLNRVPTPPSLDPNGDIKGKLADFFFDHGTGVGRRKPKTGVPGHWDSDALLMSYLSSDKGLYDEDGSDEGPEGPRTPAGALDSFITEQNASHGTPGLVMTPGGYLGVKGNMRSYRAESPGSQDVWLQIEQNGSSLDDSALTALALREEDERRKFEWLIPEHLPNSILCPLHPLYNGYSKGVCYWHVLKKSKDGSKSDQGEGSRIGHRRAEEWTRDRPTRPVPQRGSSTGRAVGHVGNRLVKKRRLESFWAP